MQGGRKDFWSGLAVIGARAKPARNLKSPKKWSGQNRTSRTGSYAYAMSSLHEQWAWLDIVHIPCHFSHHHTFPGCIYIPSSHLFLDQWMLIYLYVSYYSVLQNFSVISMKAHQNLTSWYLAPYMASGIWTSFILSFLHWVHSVWLFEYVVALYIPLVADFHWHVCVFS